MVIYNKAVRDKIPEIIKADGKSCTVKILSDGEFLDQLEKKLVEEVQEYQNDRNPEELADVLEVIYRIAHLRGVSREDLENTRIRKADQRGAFEKNLFLVDSEP